ncbi:hypothetical protein [Massilia sp. Mn16-1_5]|uniref:hypothetical protein n=1 Tax=Massilia sp. Mn16-1_5 TaxID=2079199 RepID=UPI00109E73CA|nr:hypothetical protein [Massilia sp. Mn16-1_5]THC40221.1 hypothetical protein C2862_22090 [Massilia sp. Mn16-1_5]
MIRLYLLYFFTFFAEMVGGVIPIFWLHHRVATIFLLPAAIAGSIFFYLLHRHQAPRQKIYTVYAAFYLAAVMLYFLFGEQISHPRIFTGRDA